MVELVRKPSCSLILNGTDLGLENGRERDSKDPVDYDKGDTTFRWGENRVIPGVGEDFVYLLRRWLDCCQIVVCFG